MEKQHLDHFRKLFVELGQNADLELKEALLLEETQRGDDADRWQSEQNNSLQIKLIARTRLFKKKIENSLRRIDEGTFGECEDCGAEIGLGRLMARPTAELCINCKEEQESGERNIRYDKRSHTLGKSLVGGNILNFQSQDDQSGKRALSQLLTEGQIS